MSGLGTYIREKRTLRDLSIRRLAEAADISHTEIKRIEDGVRKQPSPQVLRAIAAALIVPYEEIMEAAGYIDAQSNMVIAASAAEDDDLTEDEREKVKEYIEFIKSQRK